MKKILLPITIAGLMITMCISPGVIYGQDSLYRRDWICCKCQKWFKHDYPKDRSKMGLCKEPECNILCPDCSKGLGTLETALEKLKQRNRDLNLDYQKKTAELDRWNKRFYDVCMETFGRESEDGGWTLDGLNGSFGGFFTSMLSLASDFSGTGATTRLVDKKWLGTGLTLVTNGMGIYQTIYDSAGDYSSVPGYADAVANYGGTITDFLTLDYTTWIAQKIDNAKMVRDFGLGRSGESIYYRSVYQLQAPPRIPFSEAHINGLEKFGLFADVWAMGRATQTLIDNLADIGIAWENTAALEKELEKIQNEILENNELMACIKRTLDYQNKGTSGYRNIHGGFSGYLSLTLIGPIIISSYPAFISFPLDDPLRNKFSVNEIRFKSAMAKLKQIKAMKNDMISHVEKDIIPNFLPWITNRWKQIKPAILIKLLQKTKGPFADLIRKCEEMTRLGESIRDDLRFAVIVEKQLGDGSGNIENSPLSEYEDGSFYITGNTNESTGTNTEKWSMVSNQKIPAGKGRVNLKFPANVQWNVDIYSVEDKFFANRSSYSKHGSYDLVPGNYKFILNSVPVGNASVENGKETVFKVGIFNMMSRGSWELYDESKKTYYTSRNIPVKIALPVGKYILSFEKKDYKITIRNGMTLKFDFRKPLFVDQ